MRTIQQIDSEREGVRAKLNALRDEGELLAAAKGGPTWDPGSAEHAARIAKGIENHEARVKALGDEYRETLTAGVQSGLFAEVGPSGSGSFPFGGLGGVVRGMRASYATPLDWGAEFIARRNGERASILDSGTTTAVTVPLSAAPIADGRAARFVFQLINVETAPAGVFSYLQQTVRTTNAAVVPVGTLKPTSVYTVARIDETTKVIAHLSEPVDRFLVQDAPLLRRFLNEELLYGLNRALDTRIVEAIQDAALSSHSSVSLGAIRAAITHLQEDDIVPTGVILSPADWESVEADAAAAFVGTSMDQANDAFSRRLYGLPVTVTTSIDDGEAIVGDFATSIGLWRTGQAEISVHDSMPRSDGSGGYVSDAAYNQLVFRAEMRAEVGVLRPAGFVQISTGS